MNLYKFIYQVFNAKAAKKDSDFSAFVSAVPLTRKQLLIEECKKHDVSIYIDDPSEQSAGDYAIFRGVVSEDELEFRLNPKRAISLSRRANVIAFFALIVSVIALVKSFL
jgi:hypothetical protein